MERSVARLAILPCVASALLALGCSAPVETARVTRPAKAPSALLIRHVAVLDVATGERALGRDVLVRDSRIAAIETTGSVPAGNALVIEGNGRTLLPGLIDMHGHVSLPRGPLWEAAGGDPVANMQSYLYAGVTSVLDPADSSGEATSRRDRVARGELIGPRIQTSGKMVTCPGGHPVALTALFAPAPIAWLITPGMAHQVETREEAHAAVDALAKEGVDVIKVAVDRLPPQAPRISVATMQAIDQRTRQHDLRWVAHVGSLQDAIDAGEAGVSLWVHGIARERISNADVERLASFDIPMVVTIEVMDRMLRGLEAPIDPIPMELETVPQEVLDSFYPPPERFREVFDAFGSLGEEGTGDLDVRAINAENTLRLREAGVTILAGSDSQGGGVFPGASLHRELAQLVRAGFTPAEAIRAATLDPATWLARGQPIEFGAVRVGLQADLLLVEGDPTEDIARLQDISEVIVAGTPLERSPVTTVASAAH